MNRAVLRVAGLAARLFYHVEELGGRVPAGGPVILVGNHPNGLVDPVVLALRTARPVRFLGKAPLFDLPVLGALIRGMRTLPVYRAKDGADTAQNEATFEAVYEALRAGDLVCLFPEGVSHSEPTLQRLKTGAARMALGAERACSFELGVRIVPVGLVYRGKERYRGRVASWVGEPIDARELRSLYERDERAAAVELTARIERELRRVTLNLDDWADLPLVEIAEQVARGSFSDTHRLERQQALARGLAWMRANEPERADELAHKVAAFRARLRQLGLSVGDLRIRYDTATVTRYVVANVLALALGVPLFVAGVVLWCVPYLAVRVIASLSRAQTDVLATIKLVAALLLFPSWYAALVVGTALWVGPWACVAIALLAPPLGPFATRFWQRRAHALEDAQVFFRVARAESLRERLRERRDSLAAEIEATRERIAEHVRTQEQERA